MEIVHSEMVHTARFDSPIGPLRVATTEKGLAYLQLPRASGRGLEGWIARQAGGARCVEAWAPSQEAIRQVLEYLEGKRDAFDLALDLRGTPFQRAVWKSVLAIPYGQTRSYLSVAKSVRRAKAVRAVGAANGANPVPLVVPCHRVIASDGSLGGYGGGLDTKRRLLAMEQGRASQGRLL
jgi:O-6-methylguanine DNA methyltransferase